MSKKVLIFGMAKNGIGAEIAKKFWIKDWIVYGSDIDKENIDISSLTDFFLCDVTKPSDVDAIFKTLPAIDVVIIATGVNFLGSLETYTKEQFMKTLEVNLYANFLITQKFFKYSKGANTKKTIIHIGSDTSEVPRTRTQPYGASKRGLQYVTMSTHRELNRYEPGMWSIIQLDIGIVDGTRMDKKTYSDLVEQRGGTIEDWKKIRFSNIPMMRPSNTKEVANWVYFLSTDGRYAGGRFLRVDGGEESGSFTTPDKVEL